MGFLGTTKIHSLRNIQVDIQSWQTPTPFVFIPFPRHRLAGKSPITARININIIIPCSNDLTNFPALIKIIRPFTTDPPSTHHVMC